MHPTLRGPLVLEILNESQNAPLRGPLVGTLSEILSSGSFFHPQPPSLLILLREPGSERKVLTKGVKVLETAVGAVFAPTRFSLVRIFSTRDLVADGKSLLRNSGVGGGGGNLILISECYFSGKGPETAWRGGGLLREGVVAKNFVLSLESLSSFGFEERNLGCPGNFAGCPGPLGVFQKFVLKKFVRIFRSPIFLSEP